MAKDKMEEIKRIQKSLGESKEDEKKASAPKEDETKKQQEDEGKMKADEEKRREEERMKAEEAERKEFEKAQKELEEQEEFCPDCCLPLVDGEPISCGCCNCDEFPRGKHLANRFKDRDMDAAVAVSALTGINDSSKLNEYINKLVAYNRS